MGARVRILLDYRPALRQRTGVGEYAHELATALLGVVRPPGSVTLFSSSWKDRLAADVIPGARTIDAHVPVSVLNAAWHRLEWPPIERFAGPVDIAHSMHPLLMPARRAAQIVTIYDLYFLDHAADTAAEIRRDYPALAADHARRADAVITISEYTAAQIRSRFSVDADRIAVCPPGAPAWRPIERHAARGPILFMGTIEPRKNVGLLLRAYAALIARLPDAPPLVLAGKVAPACQDVIDSLQQPALAGRATHVGYVSGAGREQRYREASMLVLPSLDEGFGMPAVEAMAIGLPVVASTRGALPEVIGDAGLLVDAADAGALSAAMERMLTDDALVRQSIARGLDRARRFTWAASAARLADTYHAAADRRRTRA